VPLSPVLLLTTELYPVPTYPNSRLLLLAAALLLPKTYWAQTARLSRQAAFCHRIVPEPLQTLDRKRLERADRVRDSYRTCGERLIE